MQSRTWILHLGTTYTQFELVPPPPVVTSTASGLITSDIYNHIKYIQSLNIQQTKLKIYPATEHYWYLFKSSDKLVKLKPESENTLRLEIDKGRLIYQLSLNNCQGEQGPIGNRGLPGKLGLPGPPEVRYTPNISGAELYIDNEVTITLDTDISIRIYRGNETIADISLGLDSTITSVKSDYNISLDIKLEGAKLSGKITLINYDWSQVSNYKVITYKASQKGRTGTQGLDGSRFIEPIEITFTDDILKTTTAIISLRYSGRNIRALTSTLFQKVCVPYLYLDKCAVDIPFVPQLTPKEQLKAIQLASADITTDSCKEIYKYSAGLEDPKIEALILPDWTPIGSCITQRSWSSQKYTWWDDTYQKDEEWQKCTGPQDTTYPWKILPPHPPEESNCCQEDFFWCQNVQDGPCGTTVTSPILPPSNVIYSQTGCGCECPIELLVQGGYEFEEFVITESGIVDPDGKTTSLGAQSANCVVSATPHKYLITIYNYSGSTRKTVWSFTTGSSDCNETCPIDWQVEIMSNSGTQSPLVQTGLINNDIEVTYDSGGKIQMLATVNLSGYTCCLGYNMAITTT